MSTTRVREGERKTVPTSRIVTARRWLLLGVAVLPVLLVALVVHERHRARHLLTELPRRLGLDIQSETNDFTISQSIKGRVLFTVHAAKAIQRQNGKTTLHNVSITVHPKPGVSRPDTIRGDQFEYDQANGVIEAVGVVHLDLAAPKSQSAKPGAEADRIAVTANHVIFLQKLGVLATDNTVQIAYGDLHGSARGAEYETDTGLLHLRSDVYLDGSQDGKPVHVTAATADFDRVRRTATLRLAHVQVDGNQAAGDRMVFTSASGDGPRTLDAEGHVTAETPDGEHLAADRVHTDMDGAGRLQRVAAQGGVQLQDDRYKATAGVALLHMNALGRPQQAELSTAVHISLLNKPGQPSNELSAPRVDFNLLNEGSHTDLKDMTAEDGAVLSSVDTATHPDKQPQRAEGQRVTTLTARSLHAITATDQGQRYIAAVDGLGGTELEQTDSLGNRRVSRGDVLHAVLLPPAAAKAQSQTQALLRSAVQTGHVDVRLHKILPAAQGSHSDAPRVEDDHATAQQAEWDNMDERLRLTGSPVLTGPGVQLAGDTLLLSQKTATTDATGHVRGFLQRSDTGNADPVHVLAERGQIHSDTGAAEFLGETVPVRLWTTTSQLEAAEVDIKKAERTLTAHSIPHASQADVRLLLRQQSSSPAGKSKQQDAILVHGQQLVITQGTGETPTQIETTGEVRVISGGNDVRADRVVATLTPSHEHNAQPAASGSLLPGGGSLQSMVATGNVRLQQPGRTGRGQELLYTAKDDQYRLSGSRDKPAVLHDSLRGDLSGATVVFHGDDERAEVAGEASHPVHTEVPAPSARSHLK